MSDEQRRWTVYTEETPAAVIETMRTTGNEKLHDEVVRFLLNLALEVGLAVDAGKPLPGDPMGARRYNVEVPFEAVLISYSLYPGVREIRVTDMVWLRTG